MKGRAARAAIAGALIAPLTLGVLIALPFLAPLALPRGDSPHPATELLVDSWTSLKFAGALMWGVALALITGENALRFGLAGLIAMVVGDSLVFGPLSAALAPLFPITLEDQPHREMAVTFPIAAATVVVLTGIGFAVAARRPRLWPVLSIGAGGAAAAAAVISIALLYTIGVRTGGGDLAMPRVFAIGTLAATAVAGAIEAAALAARGRTAGAEAARAYAR
ncbi:MAG TPA: hypothetical protein VJP45_15160 [Candidatus Limnocylindria bacterium]|nr:hypothetical protein [Candidatus Limnocylindria bacterium]